MLDWLGKNIGTILISLALLAAVTGIVYRLYRDKRQHKSSCGCSCGSCPMSGTCHKKG